MDKKRKNPEHHLRAHEESNPIAQKIITRRFELYFERLFRLTTLNSENETKSDKKHFHDFQTYQKQICDCLTALLPGLSELGISGISKRTIPKILMRHENEIRQMFNDQLPLSVAVKECIYRFYHIEILLCPRTLAKPKQYSMSEQDKKKIDATDKKHLAFRIDNQHHNDCIGDHNRVKIFVNRMDILYFDPWWGNEYLGLPPEKMLQTDLMQPGKCLIGMCHCGDEKCDPYYIDISINDDTVIWDDLQAKCRYQFDKTEYRLAIQKLQKMLTDYVSNIPHKPTEEDLEEYKKAVYEWLTEYKKFSEAAVESGMKDYKDLFEEDFMKHERTEYVAITIAERLRIANRKPDENFLSIFELGEQSERAVRSDSHDIRSSAHKPDREGQDNTNSPAATEKNLSFKIEKQKDSCDFWCWYGVRPFVNGIDLLGDWYLGIYPKEMLKKNKFFKPGKVWLGISRNFGKDFYIDISITDNTVIWKGWHEFDKAEYRSAIEEMQKMVTEHLAEYGKKLKEYKKACYEWLTQKMGIPATVAKSQMKFYEKYVSIEQCFREDYSILSLARKITGIDEIQ